MKKVIRGFTLIEVMVALLVLALGILGISKLQGTLIQNSSNANERSVAVSLAQEKIDDLKSFTDISSGTNSYDDIADNAGGTLAAASSQTITRGSYKYSLSWGVTDYYYTDTNTMTAAETAAEIVAGGGTVPSLSDYKMVTVTVGWIDESGTAQNVTLKTVVDGYAPGLASLAEKSSTGGGLPDVTYTPSTDSRVVAVSVGTSTKRETLVPQSTTQTVNGLTYTETNFTAYTYNSSNVLIRQEDFKNVACTCRFDGTSTSSDLTRTASHPEWSDTYDTYVDIAGDQVSGKVKGCVQGNGSSCDNNPDEYCDTCCRDHHDSSSATWKYDPYRSSDDFDASTGDHKHYNGSATAVTSGQYLESCRLKKVDGIWRVYEDWNLVGYKVLPETDLTDATTKSTYASYANSTIDELIDESKVAGETLTSPPTLPSALDHTDSSNYINMSADETLQLSGRGLYMDYMDATHLSNVQTEKAGGADYLEDVPYYEVEVADVTDWTSGNSSSVEVGPIDNPGNSNDYTSGE